MNLRRKQVKLRYHWPGAPVTKIQYEEREREKEKINVMISLDRKRETSEYYSRE